MTNVLDSTKSTLGRLLAAEDIRIEHQKVQGPSFDVKNRVLILPIWKDIDADLYDLMIGHEVGHALYTPADGWMNKVQEYGKEYKTFLNLVEDARIEKMMKRKYPGLKRPMYNGYTQLVERGFFGMSLEDMRHLPFADRVNVYFKLGARSDITFTPTEQNLVDRIEAAETFDEVMLLAEELMNVAKNEKSQLDDLFDDLMEALEQGVPGEGEGEGEGEGKENESGDATGIQDIIDRLRKAGKNQMADALEKASGQVKQALQNWMSENKVSSITADALEQNQEKLIDKSAYPATYAHFPNLDIQKFVVGWKKVHSQMQFNDFMEAKRLELYNQFMQANRKYISHMVREFELRRNAKQFARAKVSKTGDLDMNHIWSHKLSENLFLQTTTVPDGKNHGMLMLIDMSSSMVENIGDTIEQLVNLVLFCRKVNIPFDVYGFYDTHTMQMDFDGVFDDENNYEDYNRNRNDATPGSLQIANTWFRLKQLFHASMKTQDFMKAIQNMLMLAYGFKHTYGRYYSNHMKADIPLAFELGSTPLNESIMVLNHVAQQFREEYRIEILNTVILTDGETNGGFQVMGIHPAYPDLGMHSMSPSHRIIIENRNTRHQIACPTGHHQGYTAQLLEMYKHLTGSRVVGIYLMGGRNYKAQAYHKMQMNVTMDNMNNAAFEQQWKQEYNKHKYIGLKLRGYDTYYMVPGGEIGIEEMDMDKALTGVESSKNNLLKAFKKMQQVKKVSRVFLNTFVKQVA